MPLSQLQRKEANMYKIYDFTVKDLIEKGIKSNNLRTYLMITGLIRVDLCLSKEQKRSRIVQPSNITFLKKPMITKGKNNK